MCVISYLTDPTYLTDPRVPAYPTHLTDATDPPDLPYLLYNSTINCSCTGRLICSRVGTDTTLPDISPSSDSHSGTPRPLTSSTACRIDAFLRLVSRTVTTSPTFT